ncbi:FecCD family ABC transporter permease [Streptomyces silvensis]|uniref:ABC transporter permease n=1 Tax=Streptomyces silvensis TaxID=1765722 RepID=A0A0W7X920_9ACTN|nr:iron chelate uptake ABC transporter family permease subunit [Streptomyces silvensis]KUF19391.1 ABC transporter permease [Streptomyces silvensis]
MAQVHTTTAEPPPPPAPRLSTAPPTPSPRRRTRRLLGLAAAVGALLVAVLLSVALGSAMLPPDVVWQALTAPDGSASHATVSEARVDRTLLGVLVGVSLGVAGALIQALTRNPLADPGVLGVNAGAGFAVTLGVAVLGVTRIEQYLPLAFAGAVIGSAVVYLAASGGRGGPSPLRLTLVGVAFTAVLSGISQTLALIDTETFDRMRFWGAGTLADRPTDTAAAIAPFVLAGLLAAVCCARPLNAIALGDDAARAFGLRVGATRCGVVIAVALLCGAATAAAGPLMFVGLMVPHAVRWLTGPDWRWILAYSAVLAPAIVLVADVVGRLVVVPAELPVGVMMPLIGAPVLILLVRGRRARAL